MTIKDQLIDQAMKLPEADRLEVAERLLESVEGPPDPDAEQAWAEEIGRRINAVDAGQARLISWEQARARIAGEEHGKASR